MGKRRPPLNMDRSNIFIIIHLSFSFLLIFMSFGVAQIFQTSSEHPEVGTIALCLLYATFCLSNLSLSAYFVQLFGLRLSLILASVAYVGFTACNIVYNVWMLYTISFIMGLAASVLWTAQGVYVTIVTSEHETRNHLVPLSTRGFMNGIFFCFMQISQTLGALTATLLFYLQLRQWIIFSVMTAICACGTISLRLLRPIHMPQKPVLERKQCSIFASLSLLIDIRFLLLVLPICYSGLQQSFIVARLPPLIVDQSRKYFIFAVASTVNALGTVAFGKLSDYIHRRLVIFAWSFLLPAVSYGLLLTVWKPPIDQDSIHIYILLTIGIGMSDTILTTELYAILGILYERTRPLDAFANYRLLQAGTTALGFLQQNYVSLRVQLLTLITMLILAMISLVICHYRFSSLDTGQNVSTTKREIEIIEETEFPLLVESAASSVKETS